jgi:hypothetical protein
MPSLVTPALAARTRPLAVLVAIGLLGAPAAATARDRDDDGRHRATAETRGASKRSGGRMALETFVFTGTYAGDGAVAVTGGNGKVRKNRLVGTTVAFDFASARLSAPDANADGAVDLADLQVGERLVVQARLPRRVDAASAGVVVARRVVAPASHGADGRDDAPDDRRAARADRDDSAEREDADSDDRDDASDDRDDDSDDRDDDSDDRDDES